MKKIDFTHKELSPHILILLSEFALMSGLSDLQDRSIKYSGRSKGGTTKFDELIDQTQPVLNQIRSITAFMDYCYQTSSSVRENELIADKNLIVDITRILMNIDDKEIVKKVKELGTLAQKKWNEKIKKEKK